MFGSVNLQTVTVTATDEIRPFLEGKLVIFPYKHSLPTSALVPFPTPRSLNTTRTERAQLAPETTISKFNTEYLSIYLSIRTFYTQIERGIVVTHFYSG